MIKKEYFLPGFWKRALWGTPTRKRLSGNFFSLSIMQMVNYLLPFITIPYLFRVLGSEKFGLIAFAQSFAELFMVVIDYGFSLAAAKEISIDRDNKKNLSRIFSSVITTEIFIALCCFLVLGIIVFFVPRFRAEWPVYLLSLAAAVGSLLVSVWFFQGIEKMKYITFFNIGAKLIFTLSIFFFVKKQTDYLYVPLSNCLGYFTASAFSFWAIRRIAGIKFSHTNLKDVVGRVGKGWYFFAPLLINNLRASSGTFVLGLLTNNTIAGLYSIAEKVQKALQVVLSPLFQTVYPFFAKIYALERARAAGIFKKTILLSGTASFAIACGAMIFAPLIIKILSGNYIPESILALRILAVAVFFYGINIILGYQGLIAAGMQKNLFKITAICGISNYILLFVLISWLGIDGTSISMVATEILITIAEILTLKRYKVI